MPKSGIDGAGAGGVVEHDGGAFFRPGGVLDHGCLAVEGVGIGRAGQERKGRLRGQPGNLRPAHNRPETGPVEVALRVFVVFVTHIVARRTASTYALAGHGRDA